MLRHKKHASAFIAFLMAFALIFTSSGIGSLTFTKADDTQTIYYNGESVTLSEHALYVNQNLQNYKERIHIMEGRLIAFVIWVIIGVLFIVMGIYDFNSKKAKPFGFWANAEVAPIEDVKGYNRALGILWCVYGVLFTLIGLPLLDGQNSGLIIIPILGAMLISIAAMVAYVVGIEPKYRKKK